MTLVELLRQSPSSIKSFGDQSLYIGMYLEFNPLISRKMSQYKTQSLINERNLISLTKYFVKTAYYFITLISGNFCEKEKENSYIHMYSTFLKCPQCETSLRFLLIAIMANALFSRKIAISRRIDPFYLQITCNILGQFRWF